MIFSIQDPTTGKIIDIEGDAPPSEQELNQIFSSVASDSNLQKNSIKDDVATNPNIQETERKIQSRKPADVLEIGKGFARVDDPSDVFTKPQAFEDLKRSMNLIGSAFEGAEAAIANPILEMQKGSGIKEVAGGVIKGLKGERLGQFGDVARNRGIPEPISAAIGVFASVGAGIGGDKLLRGAKTASKAFKGIIRSGIKDLKSPVLRRARLFADGIDDVQKTLGAEYDELFRHIGDNEVRDIGQIMEVFDELPNTTLNKIASSKFVKKNPSGEMLPTIGNLKQVKSIIRKSVPEKVWNGKAAGDPFTALLEQSYGKINSVMAEGNEQLVQLNAKYSKFINQRNTISRVLYDPDGVIVENKLKALFDSGGERGQQEVFEAFSRDFFPQASDLIVDIEKYNKFINRAKTTGTILKFGLGLKAADKFIFEPTLQRIGRNP